jgi:hypothetical protein
LIVAARKVYHPPEPEDIEKAAHQLCQALDRDSDFEDGFGNLLKVIARAYAKNLTRDSQGDLLDNEPNCL